MSAAPPLVGCALHDGADIDACGCPALDSPGAIAYRGLLVKARAEIARLTAELAAARQIADARREWLGTGDAAKSPPRTDTGAIAADMLACAEAWAPGAMLMGNVRADEIAAVCRELAAARAVPADVEAAIDAYEARVTSLVTSMTGRAADDAAAVDVARNNLRAAIARAIAEARQPATVGGLLAHLASGKPFTSPRWLAGHVLRVDAATGRLWRLDYNDPDEMHLTRYVLSDRAFSISDVLAADYVVVADTPVMDHAWRTRPASRGPLPKGG